MAENNIKNRKNQYLRIPIQVIDSGLIEFMNKTHYQTYLIIDSYKNSKTGRSWPSLKTIKREGKVSRTAAQQAIKDFLKWGLIKKAQVERKKGRGYKSVYVVIKEPDLKKPLKQRREKDSRKKQKRGKNGKFTL